MNLLESMQAQTRDVMRSLFLHYKLARALFFMYLIVEGITLTLTIIAYLNFGVDALVAFLCFISFGMINTFFFLMAFSYFLYNVVRPRPPRRDF